MTRLTLRNFKSHSDTEVELGRLRVLVGANGTGKSAVLTALHCLSMLPRNKFSYVFRNERHPDLVLRRGCDRFEIALSATGPESGSWDVALEAHTSDEIWSAQIRSRVGGEAEERDPQETHPALGNYGTPRAVTTELASAALLRLDPRRVTEPSPIEQPRVEFDGFGVASVLAGLKLGEDATFERIEEGMRSLVPHFRGLRISTTQDEDWHYRLRSGAEQQIPAQRPAGYEVLMDFENAEKVPARAASDGTLLLLAILTMSHARPPRLLLLDDLEHALHPQAQARLLRALRELLATTPELQVVASTHSPYLLDELGPDEVWVAALRDDGSTACRSLADHPRVESAVEGLTTGEFWGAEGESWVAES